MDAATAATAAAAAVAKQRVAQVMEEPRWRPHHDSDGTVPAMMQADGTCSPGEDVARTRALGAALLAFSVILFIVFM